jgi:beta-phosphoglucomutase-like phosphatase (HAD superfamily)
MKRDKLQNTIKYLNADGQEYIAIQNPNYVFAEVDLCPLAPRITTPRKKLLAIVQDMDGTTTTTENLCLHSLETMVRRFTGRETQQSWAGLDRERDYPHIIGNSTTKHVEYLIRTYEDSINVDALRRAYLQAALHTLAYGVDEGRIREVRSNLTHFKCTPFLHDHAISQWLKVPGSNGIPPEIDALIAAFSKKLEIRGFSDLVRAAVDVYYQRYHEILHKIDSNDTADLQQLLPPESSAFIEPMSGVAIFLAAAKGWLGEELRLFDDELNAHSPTDRSKDERQEILTSLGRHLEKNPVRVAIVTSSIAYEAEIVLSEVFRTIREQVTRWPISEIRKERILPLIEDYDKTFDAVITASDSSEIRLKPHRDLYSLALHQLGIARQDMDKVIGFEDSESGTIAIRAAGVGLCVAVPFSDTQGHKLDHAAYVLHGGLPEAILKHHLFIEKDRFM